MSRTRRFLRFPLTRIVIALAVFAGLAWGLSLAIALPLATYGGTMEAVGPAGLLVVEQAVASVAAVAALLFVGRVIEQRSLEEIGLRPHRAARELLAGFGIGAGILCGIIGVLALLGWYHVAGFVGPPGRVPAAALQALLLFFFVAVSEETLFRGIVFRILEEGIGSWLAIAVSGLFFGLAHLGNPNATPLAAAGIALDAGVQLAAAYMLTRSLWLATGIHWAWNFFEGPVFGTPVSGQPFPAILDGVVRGPELWTGGAFGPEAGLVSIGLSGGVGVALLVLAVRRGQVVTPGWMRRGGGRVSAPTAGEG